MPWSIIPYPIRLATLFISRSILNFLSIEYTRGWLVVLRSNFKEYISGGVVFISGRLGAILQAVSEYKKAFVRYRGALPTGNDGGSVE